MTPFKKPINARTYAIVRYGCGFPALESPEEAEGILQRLSGPDRMAALWPVISFQAVHNAGKNLIEARKDRRNGVAGGEEAEKEWRGWQRTAYIDNFVVDMIRWAETDDPFRERLHRFWANHFSARNRSIHLAAGAGGYAEDAIRPHLSGRFADMLKAVVTHPFMLVYLDQVASVGPNSPNGRVGGKGLNENLAREVLELHTLGVGATYSQADVTQFAELLTGLTFNYKRGMSFQPAMAEPGAEQVLGVSYGGGNPQLKDIETALDDLARHPATAAHICGKLASHFVADVPDPDLVAQMVQAYTASDGDLRTVYGAMLDHPAAWSGFGAKVKQPVEFIASSLRALGVRATHLLDLKPNYVRKKMLGTLRQMGQEYQRPPGPDGWPDDAAAWVHPHGVAARIGWAMNVAKRAPDGPPDPRIFVNDALGDAASDKLVWAAGAAESRNVGNGLVLASAEFNRR